MTYANVGVRSSARSGKVTGRWTTLGHSPSDASGRVKKGSRSSLKVIGRHVVARLVLLPYVSGHGACTRALLSIDASGRVTGVSGRSLTQARERFDHWRLAVHIRSREHVALIERPNAGGVRPVISDRCVWSTRNMLPMVPNSSISWGFYLGPMASSSSPSWPFALT
jgi:hypothetical protein